MDERYTLTKEDIQCILQLYINYGFAINANSNERKLTRQEIDSHIIAGDKVAIIFNRLKIDIVKHDNAWPNTKNECWKALM